jgi:hypothetical protein
MHAHIVTLTEMAYHFAALLYLRACLDSAKSNACTASTLAPRVLFVCVQVHALDISKREEPMYEAHGKTYETKTDAIREAQRIANTSRESVFVWEVATDMPCAWVVAEIQIGK